MPVHPALEVGATFEMHPLWRARGSARVASPLNILRDSTIDAVMPVGRSNADGTKLTVASRDGSAEQLWTLSELTHGSGGITASQQEDSTMGSSSGVAAASNGSGMVPAMHPQMIASFASVGVEGSMLGAGGWRKMGKPTDVHVWCDTDVNEAKLWGVHVVVKEQDSPEVVVPSDCNVVVVRLESMMYPGTFLTCSDQQSGGAGGTSSSPLLELAPPLEEDLDDSSKRLSRTSLFRIYRVDPRAAQLLAVKEEGTPSGDSPELGIFEIGLHMNQSWLHPTLSGTHSMAVGSTADDQLGDTASSSTSSALAQTLNRGSPSSCQASGVWHGKSTCAAFSQPDNMRIDIRYASRSDAAIAQLFERNCSAAQRFELRRCFTKVGKSKKGEVTLEWDGTYSISPRCAPGMVLTALDESSPLTPQPPPTTTHVDPQTNEVGEQPATTTRTSSSVGNVKSCAPILNPKTGGLSPRQRWLLLPRPFRIGAKSSSGGAAGCVDIVSCATSNLLPSSRILLTVEGSLDNATDVSLNCCGMRLAAAPLLNSSSSSSPDNVDGGVSGCGISCLDHCWRLQRSEMQELRKGQIVQLVSRLSPSLGAAIHAPSYEKEGRGDAKTSAAAAAATNDDESAAIVTFPLNGRGDDGGSSPSADTNSVDTTCRFTATCWRVGRVGQSLTFTSLLYPTLRLAHIDQRKEGGGDGDDDAYPLVKPSSSIEDDVFLWRIFETQEGWCTIHPVRPYVNTPPDSSVQQESMRVCLDLPRRTTSDKRKNGNARLQIWDVHGGKNQQWKFEVISPTTLAAHNVNKRNKIVWVTYHHLESDAVDVLRKADFEVVHFTTTYEAWTYVDSRREQIAAVLSSFMSKGIHSGYVSGLELSQRIRTLFKALQHKKQIDSSPLLAFVSTQISATQALEVCDLFFSPSTGDTTLSMATQVVKKLQEETVGSGAAAAVRTGGGGGRRDSLVSGATSESSLSRGTFAPSSVGNTTADSNSQRVSTSVTSTGDGDGIMASNASPSTPNASNRFTIREKIGRGGFGVVYKAFDNVTGQYVVAKELIASSKADLDQIAKEISFLTSLTHPHIVDVKHVDSPSIASSSSTSGGDGGGLNSSRNDDDFKVQIYMEWMSGGSLADVVKEAGHRLHESTIARYVKHALLGLRYLHEQNVLHRDIKPGNLLLGSDVVKIADFGISTVSNQGASMATTKTMGTPIYLAPEALRGKFSPATDIWALGCTICSIASGREPWHHLELREALPIMFHIGTAQPPDHHPRIPTQLSPAMQAIVQKCFAFDPEERPSAEELLEDPYFEFGPPPGELETFEDFHSQVGSSDCGGGGGDPQLEDGGTMRTDVSSWSTVSPQYGATPPGGGTGDGR